MKSNRDEFRQNFAQKRGEAFVIRSQILILLIWWNDMPELDSRVRNILLVLIIISKTHIGTHNHLQDRQPIII